MPRVTQAAPWYGITGITGPPIRSSSRGGIVEMTASKDLPLISHLSWDLVTDAAGALFLDFSTLPLN